jgi:hypothetical protein
MSLMGSAWQEVRGPYQRKCQVITLPKKEAQSTQPFISHHRWRFPFTPGLLEVLIEQQNSVMESHCHITPEGLPHRAGRGIMCLN